MREVSKLNAAKVKKNKDNIFLQYMNVPTNFNIFMRIKI